jgi:hypothetical protein
LYKSKKERKLASTWIGIVIICRRGADLTCTRLSKEQSAWTQRLGR